MKRLKKMPIEEFEEVMKRNWRPVELTGDAVPTWAEGIPEDKVYSIMASGTLGPGTQYTGAATPSGTLIGGIDVWRDAPEDPVELNKDWYAIIRVPGDDFMLMVVGPIKDGEHWVDELPERLEGVEVLGVPKLPGS